MELLRCVNVLVITIGLFIISVMAKGPPRVVSQVTQRQIARVGETIRLSCPVEADPPPLLQWSKDGESIHRGWERFKVLSLALRIKNAETEDTGKYECKATNGFGHVTVDYILIVLHANQSVPPPEVESELPAEDDRPRFSEPHNMLPTSLMRPVGSSVRLNCKSDAYPFPTIHWYKDNQWIDHSALADRINSGQWKFMEYDNYEEDWDDEFDTGTNMWMLRLAGLQEEDSGDYKCVVSNDHGEISYTYKLTVIEESVAKPILIPPNPRNMTVQLGETASFMCEVHSVDTPDIQWLKRLDGGTSTGSTIKMNGQSFVVLPGGEVLPRHDGTFLNKLTIEDVTEEDSGMYICLGANNKGYNIRRAHLVVVPDVRYTDAAIHETSFWDNKALPIIIGIPAGIILIIIAITICVIKRKQRTPQPPPPTTVRVPRYPPPGQHYGPAPSEKVFDHQYAALHPQYPADATSQDRMIKTYSDKHSDASYTSPPPQPYSSTPPVPSLAPTPTMVQQHTHLHYYQRT